MLNRASEGRWLLPAAFILLGLLLGTRLAVLGIVGLRYDAMVSLATRVARR